MIYLAIFLFIVLFVAGAMLNGWIYDLLVICCYPFIYIFTKHKSNLLKPYFHFNGDFIINSFLSEEKCEKRKEIEDNGFERIHYYIKDGEISLSFIQIDNLWLMRVEHNNRLYFILNPLSHRRVRNFFKNNPSTEKEDRLAEYRDRYIDKLL